MAGITTSVEADVKRLTKSLNDLQRKRVPFVANQAINTVAKEAEKKSIKNVAREIKVPQKLVKFRHDVRGNAKAKRTELKKASSRLRFATIRVHLRGIPVFQLSRVRQAKGATRGVRAAPKRFYKGAFVGTTKAGKRLVFKALPGAEIAKRAEAGTHGRLFVPKVGVRRRLEKWFRALTQGRKGRAIFDIEFRKRLEIELTKKGLK